MTPPSEDSTEDRTGWDLSTAVVLFHDALGARLGVSATDHKTLGLIRRQGSMPLGAIATELGVVASAATAIVDRLESAGLAERFRDPADRRRVLVRLIEEAVPQETTAFDRLHRETAAFMAGLGASERQAVSDYVALTQRILGEETERLRTSARTPR